MAFQVQYLNQTDWGWGDSVATTSLSQIYCVIYTLLGVPLFYSTMANMGKALSELCTVDWFYLSAVVRGRVNIIWQPVTSFFLETNDPIEEIDRSNVDTELFVLDIRFLLRWIYPFWRSCAKYDRRWINILRVSREALNALLKCSFRAISVQSIGLGDLKVLGFYFRGLLIPNTLLPVRPHESLLQFDGYASLRPNFLSPLHTSKFKQLSRCCNSSWSQKVVIYATKTWGNIQLQHRLLSRHPYNRSLITW